MHLGTKGLEGITENSMVKEPSWLLFLRARIHVIGLILSTMNNQYI